MDFWTLPKVMAPYLGGKPTTREAGRAMGVRSPSMAAHPSPSAHRCSRKRSEVRKQVLGDVVARDVSQNVTRDHPHLGWVPTHTACGQEKPVPCPEQVQRTGSRTRCVEGSAEVSSLQAERTISLAPTFPSPRRPH